MKWFISLFILTVLVTPAGHGARFCERAHRPELLILRPIDEMAGLSEHRREQFNGILDANPGLREELVSHLRKNQIEVDSAGRLEQIFQQVQFQFALRDADLSPFERADHFSQVFDSFYYRHETALSPPEKKLLRLWISASTHELGYPEATAKHREIRYTQEKINEVLSRFPKIRESLALVETVLAKENFSPKVANAKEIPFNYGHKTDPQIKLDEVHPLVEQGIRAVYNEFQDRTRFRLYLQQLIMESAVVMAERTKPTEMALLREGKISREAALKVLISRFKSRGVNIGVLTERTNESFRVVVGKSAFFDALFPAGSAHGQEIHLVQVDYVYPVLDVATLGNAREFWRFLSSKKGIWFWNDLFDSTRQNFTCPEVFGPVIRKWIPVR